MIVFAQPGIGGKTNLLFDMHRLRARVFKDTMKWPVFVDDSGMEIDEFDLHDTVYLLYLNKNGRVIGSMRLRSSCNSTMIRDIWPEFLHSIKFPRQQNIWEISRFAVASLETEPKASYLESKYVTAQMFMALTAACIQAGIQSVFAMYDVRIGRIVERLGCTWSVVSAPIMIDEYECQVGRYETNEAVLRRIISTTGIQPISTHFDLPPAMPELVSTSNVRKYVSA